MKYCHKCLKLWDGISQPGTRETCVKCRADLHVCLNCRFYDTSKPNDCQVPNIDLVRQKDRSNFCEDFQIADRPLPDKDKEKNTGTKKTLKDIFKD